MSEPSRLRDEGPEELRELLRHAPPTRAMGAAERRRTAMRLGRYASAAAVASALSWAPGAALGAALGVAAVAVVWGVPALLAPKADPAPMVAPPRPPLQRAAPPPTAIAAPPPSASISAAPPPPKPVPSLASAAPSAEPESPPPPFDALAEEVALLEKARAALGGAPAEALALADAHAARFPAGKLGMEREIVAVDALRRLGRAAEARARGEALLGRAKGSLYEERVRKLVE
jgi:hypothetical protein